ncbi:hypothetical protein RM697_11360 [Ichthyenterobacterium sp. W332]|uniref:Uncharacterized protein n=1 Tax=Microcosmobacter mediterraneus TaxID=3075607 RepID=A0ABU2YM64_9FLAO|nr:hypothetical protein [Ichthyenterobacterium sp. W332]MDT0559252.1 hypothetical protein [Ichthyenterobacterium sp. W332]
MKRVRKFSKFIPYLYFITMIAYWFTSVNSSEGITAYPILLFGIPFIWQLIKPSRKLNFSLGIIFVCLSSYGLLAYLSDTFEIITFSETAKRFFILGATFVIGNLVMSLWMVRNSLKQAF